MEKTIETNGKRSQKQWTFCAKQWNRVMHRAIWMCWWWWLWWWRQQTAAFCIVFIFKSHITFNEEIIWQISNTTFCSLHHWAIFHLITSSRQKWCDLIETGTNTGTVWNIMWMEMDEDFRPCMDYDNNNDFDDIENSLQNIQDKLVQFHKSLW